MLNRSLFVFLFLAFTAVAVRGQEQVDFRRAALQLQGALLTVEEEAVAVATEAQIPVPPAPTVPWPTRPDLRSIPNPALAWEGPTQWPRVAVAVARDLVLSAAIGSDQVTLRDQEDHPWKGKVVARDQVTGLVAIRVEDGEFSPLAIVEEEPDPGLPVLVAWQRDPATPLFESCMIASKLISDPPRFGKSQLIHVASAPSTVGAPIVDNQGTLVGLLVGQGRQTRCLSVWQLSKLIRAASSPALTTLRRGRIGIQIKEFDDGPRVGQLLDDSPAKQADIQTGDRILAIDGTNCRTAQDVMAAIAMARAGDEVSIRLERGDAKMDIEITLTAAPDQAPQPAPSGPFGTPVPFPQLFQLDRGQWRPVYPDAQQPSAPLESAPPSTTPPAEDGKQEAWERSKLQQSIERLKAETNVRQARIEQLSNEILAELEAKTKALMEQAENGDQAALKDLLDDLRTALPPGEQDKEEEDKGEQDKPSPETP